MDKDTIVKTMTDIVGEQNVVHREEELAAYVFNAGPRVAPTHTPAVAVTPETTEQVARILAFANEHGIPVTPRGTASGLAENTSIDKPDTIILSMVRFLKLEVDPRTLTAVVGAGVLTADIKAEARKHKLLYPPDPASYAFTTIAGNIATDAGGLACVKYGTSKNYVAGLEVALASGKVIRVGGKCIKDVAGYNLTQLIAGSEGTLGVITEVTLKLVPLPEGSKAMTVFFDDMEKAGNAISQIMISGVVPSIMEFLDHTLINAVEDVAPQNLPRDAAAMLLIELDGPKKTLDDQAITVEAVCRRLGATEVRVAATPEEGEKLWEARRLCLQALSRKVKGRVSGDPAAPIDRLAEEIHKLHEIGKQFDIKVCCYGHAGDGNLHPCFLFEDDEEKKRAIAARSAFYDYIITIGGTVSAEHGIGREKTPYLGKQLGAAQLDLMFAIKQAFDPKGILNPGCMFGVAYGK